MAKVPGASIQALFRFFSSGERRRRALLRETFKSVRPAAQAKTFVFLAQGYGDIRGGGIGRFVEQLARIVASLGHNVHVLTRAQPGSQSQLQDLLSLEDGVWIHRLAIRSHPQYKNIPRTVWDYCTSMNEEIHRIASVRGHVDCVYAPIWDCEGAATLIEERFPLVTALQTPLKLYAALHPELMADPGFSQHFLQPVVALETCLFTRSHGIHAISAAIAEEIAQAYHVDLSGERVWIAPLAIEDWSKCDYDAAPYSRDAFNLLFVGRLELRKGIETLLKITPALLEACSDLQIHFVGDDTVRESGNEKTYREMFEAATPASLLARVKFHGTVSENALRGFYRDCDLFVAPSLYESFGLILVEAMIYGKAIVASRVGGMAEVMVDGQTGLLAEPGDETSLHACIETLIKDPDLRHKMGEAGRERYQQCFTPELIGEELVAFMIATQRRFYAREQKL